MRKLKLESGNWSWDYIAGKVVIRSPNWNRYLTDVPALTGIPWATLEGCSHAITPTIVRKYIEDNCLSEEVKKEAKRKTARKISRGIRYR